MSIAKTHLSGIACACVLAVASSAWSQKQDVASAAESAYYTSATTPLFNPYPNVTDKAP